MFVHADRFIHIIGSNEHAIALSQNTGSFVYSLARFDRDFCIWGTGGLGKRHKECEHWGIGLLYVVHTDSRPQYGAIATYFDTGLDFNPYISPQGLISQRDYTQPISESSVSVFDRWRESTYWYCRYSAGNSYICLESLGDFPLLLRLFITHISILEQSWWI